MKRLIILAVAVTATLAVAAQEQRKVALVVQNHAAPGASIPFMALTDALTAKLAESGLKVINPYNSVGINQNRTSSGEKTPDVSAMEQIFQKSRHAAPLCCAASLDFEILSGLLRVRGCFRQCVAIPPRCCGRPE